MKDDNLPPDNETVEDGGGCYVAGSKEQDAAHSFEEKENDVLDKFIEVVENRHFLEEFAPGGYWKVKEGMKEECNAISEVKEFISDCVAELTRLRSELQQEREKLIDYKATLRAKVMDISKYDEYLKMKVIELIDKN